MILPVIIIVVLAFIFIAYPFFRERLYQKTTDSAEDGRLDDLRSKRDITYSMLKEVQFDYESGILTEEDYKNLESRYKARAISILKDMDRVGQEDEVEDEIEKRVRSLRRTTTPERSDDIEDEIEKRVMALRHKKEEYCPSCGERRPEGARYCPGCGEKLIPEVKD